MTVSSNAMTKSLVRGVQDLKMQDYEVALIKKVGISLIGLVIGEIVGSRLGKETLQFRLSRKIGQFIHPVLAAASEISFYAKLAACTIVVPMKNEREFSAKSSVVLMVGLGVLSGVSNAFVQFFACNYRNA